MSKVTCKALLFDMDGVLISSIASVNRCWRRWAEHFGVPEPERISVAHGTRAIELMLTYKPEWRDAPDRDERLREGLRYIEDLEIADVADLKVLPGVRTLLASLPADRWTIVTSATRRLLLGRLAAAKLPYPAELISADDVKHGKPHPEPYITGAKLLGFSPADCIVVEDATTGVGSGVDAGCQVLGVTGTYPADDLYRAGAAWVLATLEALHVTSDGEGLTLSFEQVPTSDKPAR